MSNSLSNDLRVQLNSIRLQLKPSYLWELSFGDCDKVYQICDQLNVDLNGLKVIEINEMLFIADIQLLLRHLKQLIENSLNPLNPFIDVSPNLQTPQLLSQQQIEEKKSILSKLCEELIRHSAKDKIKIESMEGSLNDMCFICGSLLGYPIIYSNSRPEDGNCLSFCQLCHLSVENNSNEMIYSLSCPQKYRKLFDLSINWWFESIKSRSDGINITLKEEIKTMALVLT